MAVTVYGLLITRRHSGPARCPFHLEIAQHDGQPGIVTW
jgi:hypothetical protein